MTFIEVLVSIVLLGTVGLAVLASLQTTIVGTAIERDHARAQQWLQSGSELLTHGVTFSSSCAPSTITGTYQDAVRGNTSIVPDPSWSVNQISVVAVEFAQVNGTYGATCNQPLLNRQKVTMQVRNSSGDVVETVDIVKVP